MDASDFVAGLGLVGLIGIFGLALLLIVADIDPFPSSGSAQGIISFQERGGLFQQERVCWRDTPYAECEAFNGEPGKTYAAGTYQIKYSCERFIWVWEKASLCTILNSTKVA